MKIVKAYCAYEPEKFKQAFGFKGSTLSGVWQTAVLLRSETACGVGLGVQSVLWSDNRVFSSFGEQKSNETMFRVTQYAVSLVAGKTFDSPYELIRQIFESCRTYAKEIVGLEVTDTFVLNALVPVDLAAWQLWAKEKGIQDFDEIYKGDTRQEKLVNIPLITYHTSVEEVKRLAQTGISIFKIKLGADPDGDSNYDKMLKWDQQRALELHQALKDYCTEDTESGRVVYYFDANGRYDTKDRLRQLVDFLTAEGISEQTVLFEEPFAPENEVYVGDLPLCFAADESVHSLADVEKRITLGYKAITLKPIAKTLSVTLEMAKRAQAAGAQCFCADLTVNPAMVEWNKCVASRLPPLKGMKVGVVESNGEQNYVNWEKMLTYLPEDGSVFTVPEHYAHLVKEKNGLIENMEIEIVPARPEHVADCVRISLEVYEGIHEVYRELLGAEIHDNVMKNWREEKAASIERQQLADNAYVALLDGKVVGFAGFRMEGDVGILTNNAVDQNYRGNGIAGLLYNHALAQLKAKGVRFVKVVTGGDEGHGPARRAYEKAGFKKYLPSVTYYMDLLE